jgi:hypothetical protein
MGQQGDYGYDDQGQPPRGRGPGNTVRAGFGPQGEHPSTRPARTPPQFRPEAPPRQDGARAVPQQYAQPGFTPAYQQPGGQPYVPPRPGDPAVDPWGASVDGSWQPTRIQYPPRQPYQQPYQPPYQPRYAPRPSRQRSPHIARNIIGGIGALIGVIIVISVAANSGDHTIQTAGSTGGTAAHSASTAKTAGIGAAITLTGDSSGEQMSVTVTKVISDASGSDEFNEAPAGDRLYAVQFRLTDTGTAAYSDSPSNGATVVDSSGQPYQSGFETVTGCQSYGGTENIASGASGLGCIVFEVPKSAKITQVQFTLDSGMGPDTGQWGVG